MKTCSRALFRPSNLFIKAYQWFDRALERFFPIFLFIVLCYFAHAILEFNGLLKIR